MLCHWFELIFYLNNSLKKLECQFLVILLVFLGFTRFEVYIITKFALKYGKIIKLKTWSQTKLDEFKIWLTLPVLQQLLGLLVAFLWPNVFSSLDGMPSELRHIPRMMCRLRIPILKFKEPWWYTFGGNFFSLFNTCLLTQVSARKFLLAIDKVSIVFVLIVIIDILSNKTRTL